MDNRYFKRDGTPYTGKNALLDWGRDMGNPVYKIVKQEELPNGKWVSTVWLGLNHSWNDGSPLIFETMVFKSKDDYSDEDMERYSTEAEAIEGHKKMVEKWSKV